MFKLSGKTGLWLISRGARHQKPQIKCTDSSIWETCKTSASSFSKPLLSAFPSLKISSNQKLKQFSNLGKKKKSKRKTLPIIILPKQQRITRKKKAGRKNYS